MEEGSTPGLWKSDGTSEGTVRIDNEQELNIQGHPDGGGVIDLGGTLFFTADDGTHGYELWTSDGTVSGTHLLKDIYPQDSIHNEGHSYPHNYVNFNGTLFFVAGLNDDSPLHGLWKSDGTSEGTVRIDNDQERNIQAVSSTHLTQPTNA